MKIDKSGIKKILLITLSNIGDVVLTLPVLGVLKREFPKAEITVMVGHNAGELFQEDPSVSKVIVYDKHMPLFKKLRLGLELRRLRFDMTVDLRNSLFGLLIGARYNTPFAADRRDAGIHRKDKHLNKLKNLGIDVSNAPFYISSGAPDKAHVRAILNEFGILPGDDLVSVCAGAKSHTKRWTLAGFTGLCERLTKETGVKVLLIGDNNDSAINRQIAAGLKNVYDLSGRTNLRELSYLLSLCRLLVTNDSAPLHIASCLNIPTVAIFGPSDPAKYGPLSDKNIVIKKGLVCSPCEKAQCKFNTLECIREISGDKVFNAARELLIATKDMNNKAGYKRILLVRTDRLGDVVLTTPAVKAVRLAYPDAYIAMMVKADTALAVKGNPYLDEVIVYDKDGRHKSVLSSVRFAIGLRKKRFDVAIIFDPSNRAHIIPYLAGIPRRIGYNENLPFLLTDRVKNVKHEGKKHEVDYSLDMLKVLGIEARDREPYIAVDSASAAFIDSLLASHGIAKEDRIVTLHPGASCPSKIWPPERFAAAADELILRYGLKIAVFSGNDNRGKACVDSVKKIMSQEAVFLRGELNLSQTIALIKRSALLISNDSGPVHIAVAVKTPVVAIFGRKQPGLSPLRWGPIGKDDIILHKDVGCLECLAHNCKMDFKCLLAIEPGEVIAAAGKLLKETK